MAEDKVKLNKDGLVPGSMVNPKDHARILREKNKDKAKAK